MNALQVAGVKTVLIGLVCGGMARVDLVGAPPVRLGDRSASRLFDDRMQTQRALRRAVNWLWQSQAEDGGWHSSTYALLESGQALTPMILQALLQAGQLTERKVGKHAALAFIRRSANKDGVVGLADPEVPEYPTYATAYALRCLSMASGDKDRQLIAKMAYHLMAQQYRTASGFGPRTVVYGGWGFGGSPPAGSSPGHVDIHHTRCVLEALRSANVRDAHVYQRATAFLLLMQRHPDLLRRRPPDCELATFNVWNGPFDGGFYFSPVVLAANKAGLAQDQGSYYRSYATATCDGILALLACGVPASDERVLAAEKWLLRYPEPDWPGGIPRDSVDNWGCSICFTHFAVRAQTMRALNMSQEARQALCRSLMDCQRADGSFRNDRGFLMKEDDPLLCTALGVLALSASIAD